MQQKQKGMHHTKQNTLGVKQLGNIGQNYQNVPNTMPATASQQQAQQFGHQFMPSGQNMSLTPNSLNYPQASQPMRGQQPRSKSGKAGTNVQQMQDGLTGHQGAGQYSNAGPNQGALANGHSRGYSLDQKQQFSAQGGKHSNIMMMNNSLNLDSQQQAQSMLSNYTKGANLPQYSNNQSRMIQTQQRLTGAQTQMAQMIYNQGSQSGKHGGNQTATYQHQQRKLNYSPVMNPQKQQNKFAKKNNLIGQPTPGAVESSVHFPDQKNQGAHGPLLNHRVPGKRAHSKNEKYEQLGTDPLAQTQADPIGLPMNINGSQPMMQQQKVQHSYDKAYIASLKAQNQPQNSQQQRYSPMGEYYKSQGHDNRGASRDLEGKKRGNSQGAKNGVNLRNNNFVRPSSANAKRKEGEPRQIVAPNQISKEKQQQMGMKQRTPGASSNGPHVLTTKQKMGTQKLKNTFYGVNSGMMNQNQEQYLNSMMSPNMIQGQNYLNNTMNRKGIGSNGPINMDGRRTQQEMKQKSHIQRNGNQTQMQMYNTKQNPPLLSQSGNAPMGKSPGGLYNSGSAQSANQISGAHNKNFENTVNINMNIMNIGLQGQLIGVNGGPVQANHNVMGGAQAANSSTKAGSQPHRRSQSQASQPGQVPSRPASGKKAENDVEGSPLKQLIQQQEKKKADRSRSNDNFNSNPNHAKMGISADNALTGAQKRPKSTLDNMVMTSKTQAPPDDKKRPPQNRTSDQNPLTQSKSNNQTQNPSTAQSLQKPLPAGTAKPAKPVNPAYLVPFSYYSSNPKQMYTNSVTKFAFATKTGLSPSNPHKVNQDSWITVPHFCGMKYSHFFSVADGHGQNGEKVSGYMKQKLPLHLESQIRYMLKKYTEDLQQNQKNELLNTDEVCIAFNNAFLNCNDELFAGALDIRFSGSTCVSVLTLGQKLFCSNVGDSRGIIVKKKQGDVTSKIITQAISRDQKPCQADEAARILKYGGRIDSFRDPDNNPIGPLRVWLKNEDIPGLAMTRSFGDQVASKVGVTAEPEILELDLCPDDRFIVLASDGVWEFLANEEIAKIVMPYFECKNAEKAAEAVVRESYLKWKQEEDDIVDDITCVIIFLDVKMPQQQPNIHLQNQYKEMKEREEREKQKQSDTTKEGKDGKESKEAAAPAKAAEPSKEAAKEPAKKDEAAK